MENLKSKKGLEIERRFLIKMPDKDFICALKDSTVSEILQTYLESEPGTVRRVRERRYRDRTVYVETIKTRVDQMSSIEEEREICEEEYRLLLDRKEKGTSTVAKTRYTFPYYDRVFEIDVYPLWLGTAVMEIELPSSDAHLDLPAFIDVIREITGVKAYSNYSLAHSFPPEPKE